MGARRIFPRGGDGALFSFKKLTTFLVIALKTHAGLTVTLTHKTLYNISWVGAVPSKHTGLDCSRADNGSHILTRDPRDPSVSWPVTRMTRDSWPSPRTRHESITTTYESWWVHDYCLPKFWMWLMQCNNTVSLVVYTAIVTSWTRLNSSLITGQVLYGTDPWPTWPIHIVDRFDPWPMTRWPIVCYVAKNTLQHF